MFRAVVDFELPAAGSYATGMVFLSTDTAIAADQRDAIAKLLADEGCILFGTRVVPTDTAGIGASAQAAMPVFEQIFVARRDAAGGLVAGIDLERHVYMVRKRLEHELGVYLPSLSTRTFVYKGMLTAPQLRGFYPDLSDERAASALCLVHSRFSTNTFPSWPLAHPYRVIAHNGEINTVQGNENWMRARKA